MKKTSSVWLRSRTGVIDRLSTHTQMTIINLRLVIAPSVHREAPTAGVVK